MTSKRRASAAARYRMDSEPTPTRAMVSAAVQGQPAATAERELPDELYREVVDGAPAMLFVGDVDGNGVFANQRWLDFTGWTAERLRRETWWDIVHPDDLARVRAEFERDRAARRPLAIECRVRRADGQYRWILASSRPRFAADGEFAGYVGACIDITDRKTQAERRTAALLDIARVIGGTIEREELLDKVQRRTAALLPCDRVVTFHWDPASDAFRAVAQYGVPEDLLPDTASLIFRPGVPMVDEVVAGNVLVVDERSDPSTLPVALLTHFRLSTFAAVPLSVHGRTVGCLVVHRNADSTTFADDELELAEGIARQLAVGLETVELLQAQRDEAAVASALARVSQELISSLDRPILLDRLCRIATEVLECDCAHSFLWEESDGAFVAVAGYGDPPEDWESLRTLQLPRRLMLGDEGNEREFWTGQFDEVAGHLGTLARQSGLITGLRVVLRRGDEMVGILTAAHRRTNRHFSIRHQRIARGISQLAVMALENARLVEALQQASRLKSDFVASMSHELRTPLNVIIGYNNLLMEGEFGTLNDDQVETTRRMRRSAAELFELINTTLDLSRLEAGRLPVSLSELRVTDLIEEIDAETAAIRQKDSVVFAWDVHTALPPLWTDRLKLKVVIKNLIGNAMKFTTRGRVTVSVHLDGDHVTFTVRDTGIGIPPDAQAVIFEPFRQAESSIGQNYGGVGLGLYIAQRLVTLLGGTIGVESVPDIGSTFHVALPRRGPS